MGTLIISVFICIITCALIYAVVHDEMRVEENESVTLTWSIKEDDAVINIRGPGNDRYLLYLYGHVSTDMEFVIPNPVHSGGPTIGFTIEKTKLEHAGEYKAYINGIIYDTTTLFVYGTPHAPSIIHLDDHAVCQAVSVSLPVAARPDMTYSWIEYRDSNIGIESEFIRDNFTTVGEQTGISEICCVAREVGSTLTSPRSDCMVLGDGSLQDSTSPSRAEVETVKGVPGITLMQTERGIMSKQADEFMPDRVRIIVIVGGAIVVTGIVVIVLACLVMRASKKKKGEYPVEIIAQDNEEDANVPDTQEEEIFPEPPAALVRMAMLPEIVPEILKTVNDDQDLPLPPPPNSCFRGPTRV